jgi:hypothetical protein
MIADATALQIRRQFFGPVRLVSGVGGTAGSGALLLT